MRTNLLHAADRLWDRRSTIVILLTVLVADAFVAYVYVTAGFWVALGGLVAAGAVGFLLSSPRSFVLAVFVAKPIIDMLWFASAGVAGVSLNASSIFSVVAAGVALMLIVLKRIDLPRVLFLPMLAVLAANLWTLLESPNLAYGGEYLIRVVCGLPLALVVPALVEQLPAPRKLINLFLVVVGVVYLTVLLQPLGVLGYRSFDADGVARASGFYYHPWDVARYLVIALPLILALLADRQDSRARIPYLGLLVATGIVTAVTFLKAAWIVVFGEIILWFMLTGKGRRALAVLVIAVVVMASPLRDVITPYFSDLEKLESADTRSQALSGRIGLWDEYISSLENATPLQLLFGQGFEPVAFQQTGRAAANDLLRILVMTGALGLLAYAALLVFGFRTLHRAVRQLSRRRGFEWRIGVAVECIFAAYLAMGFTAEPSAYPSITMYLWLLIGLVIGYAKLDRARDDEAGLAFRGVA